jgi:hypothetical protein
VGDVHVNRLLTQLSVGWKNPDGIADQIFPVVFVNKQSDIVPKYDQSPWFRDEGSRLVRAPGTEAVKTGLSVDVTDTYWAVNNALGGDIPNELIDNQDAPFQLEQDVARLVQSIIELRRERLFASTHMATSQWGADQSLAAKWSDYGSSTPITDLRAAIRTIRRRVGQKGNKVILGDLVWQRLEDHPNIIARLSDDSFKMPTRADLARLLELPGEDSILVGESMYTTSPEGTAEASVTYADVWADDALVVYVPPVPSLMSPSAGYTFVWRNSIVPNGMQFVRSMEDTKAKKRTVEVHTYFHQKKVVAAAGQYIDDAVD